MNLGIAGEERAVRREGDGFIAPATVNARTNDTAEDASAMLASQRGEEGFILAGTPLAGDGEVHREAAREHLGEDDESVRHGLRGRNKRARFGEVRGFVFPGDVELDQVGSHCEKDNGPQGARV